MSKPQLPTAAGSGREKPTLPHQDGAPADKYKTVKDIEDVKLREDIRSLAESLADAERTESIWKITADELKEALWDLMRKANVTHLSHAEFKFYERSGEYTWIDPKTLTVELIKRKLAPEVIEAIIATATKGKPWSALVASDSLKPRGRSKPAA